MALSSGTSLGPYEIQSPLGAGGMGEVYRARDTRLDRTVAIKVLPEHVAADPDLKQRFEREAKTVAGLSHPHICPVFDVGSQDGIDYLVMEYLDGETLAQRLEKGALPLDQALQIAIEIADALDKAHRQGIVHRDLKPGNIMLTKAGAKLLDFGLAKPIAGAGLGPASALATRSESITGEGKIFGTLQYMAPEQLEGKEADHRTDIFAFGAVVYELVTGRKAFPGENQASVIAAILEHDPAPVSTVQPLSPTAVDRVVRKSLSKDPEVRWQSARDLADELRWLLDGGAGDVPSNAASFASGSVNNWRVLYVSAAAALVAAIGSGVLVWSIGRSEPEGLTRFALSLSDSALHRGSFSPDIAISPDGNYIAFVTGGVARGEQLHVRARDQLTSRVLVAEGDLSSPFFSPDSQFIGFEASGGSSRQLKRVSVNGGAVVTVCELLGRLRGASWGADGTIVFASTDDLGTSLGRSQTVGLWRVPAVGGQPELLTTPDPAQGVMAHSWPELLPGGDAVFFTVVADPIEESQVAVLSLESGAWTSVLAGGSYPKYSPTGHLLYAQQGAVWAITFDPNRLETVGDAVPVQDGVVTKDEGAANFAVSQNGTLLYMPGAQAPQRRLVWVDRGGNETPLPLPVRSYDSPRVSPDGSRVSVLQMDAGRDLWVYDATSGAGLQLTNGLPVVAPNWNAEGSHLMFSLADGPFDIYTVPADGSGGPEKLTTSEQWDYATSVTPDDTRLSITRSFGGPLTDHVEIWELVLDGESTPTPMLHGEGSRAIANYSPDGNWILYRLNLTGQPEIVVQPYPGPGPVFPVSIGGGTNPFWSPDGSEIYYRVGGNVTAVEVTTDNGFQSGEPTELFDGDYYASGVRQYHVAPDDRFLMLRPELPTEMVLVQNWTDELLRLVPTP